MLLCAFGGCVDDEVIGENTQPCCIALLFEQVDECGCTANREFHFVAFAFFVFREIHRRRCINHNLATQVGFFLVAFHKHFIGAAKDFPIDIFGGFSGVVEAVFGKFNREPVKRRFVQAYQKTFHHLPGKQFNIVEFFDFS